MSRREPGFPRRGLYRWDQVDGLARSFAKSCECPASAIAYCGPCVYCQLASAIVEIDRRDGITYTALPADYFQTPRSIRQRRAGAF